MLLMPANNRSGDKGKIRFDQQSPSICLSHRRRRHHPHRLLRRRRRRHRHLHHRTPLLPKL